MSVSLVKIVPVPECAPLWWDDASYIRYQSEDPQGYYAIELNFYRGQVPDGYVNSGSSPLIRQWIDYEYPSESRTRQERINYVREWAAEREAAMAELAAEGWPF